MLVKYIIKVFLCLILVVMTLICWLLKIPTDFFRSEERRVG